MRSAAIISAAIVAAALVATMGLYLYFSPYHSCMRTLLEAEYEPADAALACLHGVEPPDNSQPAFGGSHARRAPPTFVKENGPIGPFVTHSMLQSRLGGSLAAGAGASARR